MKSPHIRTVALNPAQKRELSRLIKSAIVDGRACEDLNGRAFVVGAYNSIEKFPAEQRKRAMRMLGVYCQLFV